MPVTGLNRWLRLALVVLWVVLALPTFVEGHQDIRWLSGRITSMRDPATSPYFGPVSGGFSPVSGFTINGRDELYRHDCKGRTVYWLAGQASKMVSTPAATAWTNGLATPNGVNTVNASAPLGVEEAEFRWPTPATGCGTTGGESGWLMTPHGEFNVDYPLSPKGAATQTEWGQHPVGSATCPAPLLNSRLEGTDRRSTVGGVEGSVSGWPFSNSYDAAGNLRNDGRHYFRYDGANRLTDVYRVTFGSGGVPVQGTQVAHYGYDALGRHTRTQYDTDGDGSLADEDTEWTPRDTLGRPIGIWRQPAPTTGTPNPCARPYQLYAYHAQAGSGILDCPAIRWRDTDDNGTLDETLYYLQDFRGDVTGLMDAEGVMVERARYGPTGRPQAFPACDIDFSGIGDEDDEAAFAAALDAFNTSSVNYDPRADLDHDGDVDDKDEGYFYDSYDRFAKLANQWKLGQGDGLTPGANGHAAGYDNRFGWRGYWYDAKLQKYHVRHRVYDPREGRWLQTDPLGFDAGDPDLYRYCFGEFSTGYDPLGLDGDFWAHVWAWGGHTGVRTAAGPAGSFLAPYAIDTSVSGSANRALDTQLQSGGARAMGVSRAFGGAAVGLVTAPTGVGLLWGIDQMLAGIEQAMAADPTAPVNTRVMNVVEAGLTDAGISPQTAHEAAVKVDVLGNILTAFYALFNPTRVVPTAAPATSTPAASAPGAACDEVIQGDPRQLLWTQNTAGGSSKSPYVREVMEQGAWPGQVPPTPIDVVRTPGGLVTVDHTRALTAIELGWPTVPMRVHEMGDLLPPTMMGRFGPATTWGEAIAFRAASQNPPLPPTGTTTRPVLR